MSHRVSYEDAIYALKSNLEKALGDNYEVEIKKEVTAAYGYVKEIFDLVILYNGDAICGVDYKGDLFPQIYFSRFKDHLISRLQKVGLKYGIFYCGEKNDSFFWVRGNYEYKPFSFNNIVESIKGNQACGIRFTPDDVRDKLFGEKPQKLSIEKVNSIRALFTEDNLEYDEKTASMWLKTDAEDELFKILLKQKEDTESIKSVCRYTSLSSLFLIMREGSQVMCSITCMNDKGETSYADKYVGYGAYATSSDTIKENNDCFVLSCCNKEIADTLTMWRLYGNDGKGVCIEYDVDLSIIDNNEFFFAPISYGTKKNIHSELDLIRDIRHWNENGWRFALKRWFIWKHFFKSYLFKEEQEIRLLYIRASDSSEGMEWIMDSTNGIASRICKFPINEKNFPLKLKKVIIGPKCPEQGSNVDQFNFMNNQQKIMPNNLMTPAVTRSSIEDYR